MGRIPQVRRLAFNDESIGMGFNSTSGLAVGSPFTDVTVAADPTATGQEVLASITIVNSHEELNEKLGMSFSAQGRYGWFSGSAKAEFADSTSFNSTSTFLVARCVVQNPIRRGRDFRLTPAAESLLDAMQLEQFGRAFGDSFVRGLQTGGEFYAVVRITSVSTSTQQELALTLQAEANALVASGSFKGAFTTANASASTRSEFAATMFQKAGSGSSISPTVEIAEVIARYKAFPAIANAAPAAYETLVATYDTLPLPVPTPEEQENFMLALRDARERKLRYLQARNDLEFALRNPTFFVDLPPAETLVATAAVHTRLINAVIDHAIRLSRGQMDPPRLFEPTELDPPITEPAPLELRRAAPRGVGRDETAVVPNYVGLSIGEVEGADRCVGAFGAQTCFTGVHPDGVGIGQDDEPAPIGLPRDLLDFIEKRRTVQYRVRHDPSVTAGDVDHDLDFVVSAQFPGPGQRIAPGEELILQFQAVHP